MTVALHVVQYEADRCSAKSYSASLFSADTCSPKPVHQSALMSNFEVDCEYCL